MSKFQIRLPVNEYDAQEHDEFFYLSMPNTEERRLRVHDYPEVYKIPGLYQSLICEKLHYQAPQVIANLILKQVQEDKTSLKERVILDAGAGNGVSGAALANLGATSIIGLDIIPEAAMASQRDYPGVYSQYYVEDLATPRPDKYAELSNENIDILVMSGALHHFPVRAFFNALKLLAINGYLAISARRREAEESQPDYAYNLLKQLVDSQTFEVVAQVSYQQRLSVDGTPLMGLAILARKLAEIQPYD